MDIHVYTVNNAIKVPCQYHAVYCLRYRLGYFRSGFRLAIPWKNNLKKKKTWKMKNNTKQNKKHHKTIPYLRNMLMLRKYTQASVGGFNMAPWNPCFTNMLTSIIMCYDLGKSVWSRHFQFSIWLKCPFREIQFAENPTWIELVVPKLWVIDGFSKQ